MVQDVKRRFGSFYAVKGLSFSVRQGQIFGLLGANGAGKSTTFRMLCGLLPASEGTLRVAGKDLRTAAAQARGRIGYMAQKFSLYTDLTVDENLAFFSSAYGLTGRTQRERIAWAKREFELSAEASTTSGSLPLGFKQRLALAASLMHGPEILFLDEPTKGLDPRGRIEMRSLLQRLSEMGKTVLVSSHILPELATVADRVGIIENGRLLACGSVSEIMEQIRPNRLIQMRSLSDEDDVIEVANELVEQNSIFQPELVEDVLQFEVSGDDSLLASVLTYFVNRGIKVAWYQEQEADLEEAFMKVTDSSVAPGTRRDA